MNVVLSHSRRHSTFFLIILIKRSRKISARRFTGTKVLKSFIVVGFPADGIQNSFPMARRNGFMYDSFQKKKSRLGIFRHGRIYMFSLSLLFCGMVAVNRSYELSKTDKILEVKLVNSLML